MSMRPAGGSAAAMAGTDNSAAHNRSRRERREDGDGGDGREEVNSVDIEFGRRNSSADLQFGSRRGLKKGSELGCSER
jgi:hypothetical protein